MRHPYWSAVLIAAVAAGVVGTVMALALGKPAPQVVTFTLPAPTGAQFDDDLRDVSAVSPDGKDIVFAGTDSLGQKTLWLRPLASTVAQRIRGTDRGLKAFWSPDGRLIGFFQGRTLAVIDRGGGSSRAVVTATMDPRGASWADNGNIFYAPSSQSGIFVTSLSDSTPRQITTPVVARGEIGHMWPHALPGGRTFLYFVASDVDSVRGIYFGSVGEPSGRRIVGSPASAVYSDGHLLYVHAGALVAQRIDIGSGVLVGTRRLIADSVATSFEYYGAFSASPNGVLVYVSGRSRDISRLEWVDTTGATRGHASSVGYIRNPDLSADGRHLAFETYRETNSDIRYVDLTTGVSSVIPDDGMQAIVPVWSPDGGALAYITERPGNWGLYRKQIDRAGASELLWRSPRYAVLNDWTARGQTLILTERNEAGDLDLVARRLATLDTATILAGGPGHQVGGRVSPAGSHLAYVSGESGASQVYVQRFPSGSRCQVSADGGHQPVWGPRPGELYYLSSKGTLMRVTVRLDQAPPCATTSPRVLFQTSVANPAAARSHYDVSLKDGRLLLKEPALGDGGAWLNVIVNWLAATPPIP